jgi:hypothetical protein
LLQTFAKLLLGGKAVQSLARRFDLAVGIDEGGIVVAGLSQPFLIRTLLEGFRVKLLLTNSTRGIRRMRFSPKGFLISDGGSTCGAKIVPGSSVSGSTSHGGAQHLSHLLHFAKQRPLEPSATDIPLKNRRSPMDLFDWDWLSCLWIKVNWIRLKPTAGCDLVDICANTLGIIKVITGIALGLHDR